jgi:hypothetical protein
MSRWRRTERPELLLTAFVGATTASRERPNPGKANIPGSGMQGGCRKPMCR